MRNPECLDRQQDAIAAEMSKEWGGEIYIAQVDLCKAFDRVKHSAAIDALKLQSASL